MLESIKCKGENHKPIWISKGRLSHISCHLCCSLLYWRLLQMQAVLIGVNCLGLGEKWYMWVIPLCNMGHGAENHPLKRMCTKWNIWRLDGDRCWDPLHERGICCRTPVLTAVRGSQVFFPHCVIVPHNEEDYWSRAPWHQNPGEWNNCWDRQRARRCGHPWSCS